MSLVTKPYTFTAGAVIVAAEHNSNFDTIYNDYNGNIDNDNIKSSAAIEDSKLAQITTPSKVSGAALTALANTPSAAGALPTACGGLGSSFASVTSGSMIYFSGVGTASSFASGTSGQFLLCTGASSAPRWSSLFTASITTGSGTQNGAGSEVDMTSMSSTITGYGTSMFIMFSGEFTVSATAQSGNVYIDVDGADKQSMAYYIYSNGQVIALQHLETGITPGSHTVKVRWNGTSNTTVQATRILTCIDLP